MSRILAILLSAIALMLCISLSHGDHGVPLADVVRILAGDEGPGPAATMIVLEFRLPRALLALAVGVALGVAGVIAQAVMRNPLAEPGLLGISSGAGLAAMVVLVHARSIPQTVLPVASFIGAMLMTAAILALAWRDGTSSVRIILIGIGLNALASGAATFMATFGDVAAVQLAMVWLAGSVQDSSWQKLGIMLGWLVPALVLALVVARELDVLGLSDDTARGLGQRTDIVRLLAMMLCALIAGIAVAAAGLVGFVGLIAPHLARGLVGRTSSRQMPVAGLIGGLLVMAADFAGRTVVAPAQIPVGLTTAIIGTPFFAYLLWRQRNA